MKMIGKGDRVNGFYILDSNKFAAKANESFIKVFRNSIYNVSSVVNNVNA